ncbi:MAG: T9SS type A sorting domain-containing protein [Bacteroidetes bacterium]|nr:T9SS type A sorting domain-containing protein [Bacteroidota bacterium]
MTHAIIPHALNNTSSTNISNLSVSPNPTSGFATLTFDYLPSAGVSATIKIINSHGTLLQTISPVSIANGSNSIAINLSSYTAGVYYIEIILPTGNYHYSAVKY